MRPAYGCHETTAAEIRVFKVRKGETADGVGNGNRDVKGHAPQHVLEHPGQETALWHD